MNFQIGQTIQINVRFPDWNKNPVDYEWRPVSVKVRGIRKNGIYIEQLGNEIFLHYSFGPTIPPKHYYLDLVREVTMPCYSDNTLSDNIDPKMKRDIEWGRKGYEFMFC